MHKGLRISVVVMAAALSASCDEQKPHPAKPTVPSLKSASVFGVRMGDDLSTLVKSQALAREDNLAPPVTNYSFSPKEPNAQFDHYSALVTKQHGVCGVLAEATAGPAAMSVVLDALKTKYGNPTFDGLAYYWWPGRDHPNGPYSAIDTLLLTFLSEEDNSSRGRLAVHYVFKNHALCERDLQASGL